MRFTAYTDHKLQIPNIYINTEKIIFGKLYSYLKEAILWLDNDKIILITTKLPTKQDRKNILHIQIDPIDFKIVEDFFTAKEFAFKP